MRVLDILENLSPLDTNRIGTQNLRPISWNDHMPNQVTAIKQNLKRHTLVTGRTSSGRQTGGSAWTGEMGNEWTQELDQAILAWKRSINLQVPPHRENSPLELTSPPTLKQLDIDYLQKRELTNDGFLKSGEQRRTVTTKGPFEGFTYEKKISGTVEDATDTNSMLEAVGPSAWWRIACEIKDSQLSQDGESWLETTDTAEVGRVVRDLFLHIYSRDRGMTFSDEAWQTTFDRKARDAIAVYLDGEERIASGSITISSQAQFEKYSNMAIKLWEKDTDKTQQTQQQANVGDVPTTASTLQEPDIRAIATALNKAFENQLTAALPGGRSFYNDKEAIATQLAKMQSAKDYDDIAAMYQQLFNEKLHERFYSELDMNDYATYFVSRLIAIQKIAPGFLQASINFGQEDTIETEYEGKTYKISKNQRSTHPQGLQHFVSNYNGYDVIVVDGIYRAAIQSTGGVLPDFDAPPAAESIQEAQILFINTINTTYPEMVAFYARTEPFDAASVDLGGARLKNIIQDAARLMASPEDARRYITEQIADDRGWLTGEDGGEAGANIYFDSKYIAEGNSDRPFEVLDADQETELDGGETDLQSQILDNDPAVVRAAIDELLQEQNGRDMYENIYRQSASSGMFLDKLPTMGDDKNDITAFITASTNSNSPILRVATKYGLAIAAPQVCAELFRDAIKGIGTDEDIINALVNQIKNREDYEFIDERYKKLPGVDDSLIDDLASEQLFSSFGNGWYARLANIIGSPEKVEEVRVELDRRIGEALSDLEADTSIEHIENIKSLTKGRQFRNNEDQLGLVIDRLDRILDDMLDPDAPEYIALVDYRRQLAEVADKL